MQELFPERPVALIVAMAGDKDHKAVMAALRAVRPTVVLFTSVDIAASSQRLGTSTFWKPVSASCLVSSCSLVCFVSFQWHHVSMDGGTKGLLCSQQDCCTSFWCGFPAAGCVQAIGLVECQKSMLRMGSALLSPL